MEVEHCPTEILWADILTKPKQGKNFRIFRAELLNCSENYEEADEWVKIIVPAIKKALPIVKEQALAMNARGNSRINRRSVLKETNSARIRRSQ